MLGITPAALSKYIKAKKVPAPRTVQVGGMKLQAWNDEEVAQLRQLLPKIANGRKTRYKKKQLAISNSQLAKKKSKTRSKKKK